MSNPLLLVNGNAQAQHIAAMLRAADIGEVIYVGKDFGIMPSYEGRGCRIVSPRDVEAPINAAREADQLVVQINQDTPRKKSPIFDGIRKLVMFPSLAFWALNTELFARSFKATLSIDRIFDLDIALVEKSEWRTGFPVPVASFLRENIRRKPLFHTVNHPHGALLAPLLRGIAIQLSEIIDPEKVNAVADGIADREGLNFQTDHPMSKEDRDSLGLNWGPQYELYARMIRFREASAWDDLQNTDKELSIQFSNDSQYWRTRSEMGVALDDMIIASEAFEQLLQRCPGAPGVWLSYARLLNAQGRMGRLQDLLDRAKLFYEGASAYDAFASRVFMSLGKFEQAIVHGRACYLNATDEVEAAFPFLQALVRTRREEELRGTVAELRAKPALEAWRLNAFLANLRPPWIEQVLGPIPTDRTAPPKEMLQ